MKFRTSRDTLLRPLRVVTGVVERRQTLPVLSNVLVTADENGVSVRGTDLQVEVVARLQEGVDVEDPGVTTIPAHKLADIRQSLPDVAEVNVSLEGDRAVVRSGRSRFALATIPASDFPSDKPLLGEGDGEDGESESGEGQSGEEEDDAVRLVLPHAGFRRMLDRTKFAMAHQDVRYFLNGMLFELSSSGLRAAASDGHRMAMCTLEEAGSEGVNRLRIIVPRKSILDIERVIADSDADVSLELGSKSLRVTQGEYTLTTKLVDGQFPEVDRLIPRNTTHSVTGDRESMRQALHRAAILSNEKSQDVRLHLDGDQMTVRATNPEQEESEEVVAVDYDGSTTEISFNVRYIQDVLNALDTESVKFSMPPDNTRALIEAPGDEDSLYLLMPLRR